MTTTKKRGVRRRGGGAGSVPPSVEQRTASRLPVWRWRTFPVYFAFSLGAFLGVYLGFIAGYIQGHDDKSTMGYVLFISVALLMGFAFARLTTRYLLTRRFAKRE
ncbi:MAG: hypothetical protein LC118_06820 [Dehalococcoidia bacterium]|nr:hypothetical protein [Dehalococcoidia bacterium]